MPAAVGAGTFWTEATSAVNGDKSVKEAIDAIEASWP
jgi:alpha-glucoside transport system substrate-binding protein